MTNTAIAAIIEQISPLMRRLQNIQMMIMTAEEAYTDYTYKTMTSTNIKAIRQLEKREKDETNVRGMHGNPIIFESEEIYKIKIAWRALNNAIFDCGLDIKDDVLNEILLKVRERIKYHEEKETTERNKRLTGEINQFFGKEENEEDNEPDIRTAIIEAALQRQKLLNDTE